MMSWLRKAECALVATLMFAATSNAALIPQFAGVTPSIANPGKFTFSYDVILAPTERLDDSTPDLSTPAPGDPLPQFFVIFDFEGFVAGSQETSNPDFFGFTALTGMYNQTGAPVAQDGDDPTITDLIWVWTGAGVLGGGVAPLSLGTFTADSDFDEVKLDAFQSQSTKNNPGQLDDGTAAFDQGTTTVPTGDNTPPVPEPASMILLGSGFVGLALLRRRFVR